MKIHIVQKGDTMWEIAHKYGVDFEQLKNINVHIASPDMIMPGMKIKIPTTNKHVQHKPKQKKAKEKPLEIHPANKSKTHGKMIAPEQSISLEKTSLPSPLQMPKITDQQEKHVPQPKPSAQQKTQLKKKQQVTPQVQAGHKSMPPVQTGHKSIPQVQQAPYYPPTSHMPSFPVHICPVCGQVNQQMMPYHYPMNFWPAQMSYNSYDPSIQQTHGVLPMNSMHQHTRQ